ncbi:MAG: aminopeptidase P family protein, partial [Chlamydiota bacterium]
MNYRSRIRNVQKYLKAKKLDGLIIENVLNIFYLTGLELSLGTLFVTQSSCRLVVDNRYYETCKKHSPVPVNLSTQNWFPTFISQKRCDNIHVVGFDSENTSYDQYLAHKKIMNNLKKETNGKRKIQLKAVKNPIRSLRTVKDKDEIKALKKAAKLGSEGYDYVCSLLKSGISELDVAQQLEIFWKQKGSKGVAFESIIAFGANSSMPHYRPSRDKLKKGQPVLIDIGVNLNHYHSDMTRVPFFGKPSKKMEEIYHVVLEAQEEAISLCAPGVGMSAIDAAARDLIASRGYGKYFTHSLGHGIGLEVHENPFFRKTEEIYLQEGMVITIEPGVYLPGVGGVRIE